MAKTKHPCQTAIVVSNELRHILLCDRKYASTVLAEAAGTSVVYLPDEEY